MKLWHFLTDWLDGEADTGLHHPSIEMAVNPANGLPMIEGTGVDIEGNPYSTDDFDPVSPISSGLDDCNNLSNFD